MQSKSVIKSYRFDYDLEIRLAKIANSRGMSENALVTLIISHAIETDPLDRMFEKRISLSRDTIKSMIEWMTIDQCEKLGFETAEKNLFAYFEALKLKGDMLSFFRFLKSVLADSYGWFNADIDFSNDEVLLVHSCGAKWSAFLKGYIACGSQALGFHPDISITDRFVKIIFPGEDNVCVYSEVDLSTIK